MAYTPQEQLELSQRHPGLVWVDDMPFTPQSTTPEAVSYAPDGTPLNYLGQPIVETGETTLVPANLTTRFPWEFLAAQVALPGLIAGGSALGSSLGSAGGAGGAGGGAAGASGAASAAPALSAPVLPVGGSIGGGAGAGGGGFFSSILSNAGGPAGLMEIGGNVLSGITQGMTDNRTEQDTRNLAQDSLRTSIAATEAANQTNRANTQIAQEAAARAEQAAAFRNSVLGQLAGNMQDVSLDRSQFRSNVPTTSFSGGLRPSAIGETGREAGRVLSTQALDRLRNPTAWEDLPTYEAPTLSEPTNASFWEKLLSPVAAGTSALGTLATRAPQPRSVG